jgi:hypothetical protein
MCTQILNAVVKPIMRETIGKATDEAECAWKGDAAGGEQGRDVPSIRDAASF